MSNYVKIITVLCSCLIANSSFWYCFYLMILHFFVLFRFLFMFRADVLFQCIFNTKCVFCSYSSIHHRTHFNFCGFKRNRNNYSFNTDAPSTILGMPIRKYGLSWFTIFDATIPIRLKSRLIFLHLHGQTSNMRF